MRQIESLADAPLLVRTSRGVSATATGERLYPIARDLLARRGQAVDALRVDPTGPRSPGDAVAPALVGAFCDALRAGVPSAAHAAADAALARGADVGAVHRRLIEPAMTMIGELWENSGITVADEHLATAISHEVAARAACRAVPAPATAGDRRGSRRPPDSRRGCGGTLESALRELLAIGILAGRVAHQRRRPSHWQDPTSFVIDRDLVVRAAEGQSILRLPWFEDGLFVGRSLPDISEMPAPVRRLCVTTYSAALAGERGRFACTSFGYRYSVEAVPVFGDHGGVEAVLAVVTPTRAFASAALGYERTAERLDAAAGQADGRAERYRIAGRADAEAAQRDASRRSRAGAARARASAAALRSRGDATPSEPPSLTSRQIEVLSLASHGLTYAEIGEQLGVSPTTVKTHFAEIYVRLGVSDRTAAVAAVLRHGVIE
ncbi:MAG: LuxR C-terminal-related transcriptional regulator [Solirubrobacteraceae bacterium]